MLELNQNIISQGAIDIEGDGFFGTRKGANLLASMLRGEDQMLGTIVCVDFEEWCTTLFPWSNVESWKILHLDDTTASNSANYGRVQTDEASTSVQ